MQAIERNSISDCIKKIEQRFFPEQFSSGKRLRQRDLEYLMELMEERSDTRISLSTMKRLWKNEFNQMPHPSTLNALASLIDYDDWNSFLQEQNKVFGPRNKTPKKTSSLAIKLLPFLAFGLVVTIIVFLIISIDNKPIQIPDSVKFSANKTVTHNVPNSVIFSYDLQGVEADSFFIQRSWNPTHKKAIDPAKKNFSEIYYYPGFHWAHLIANDTIIRKIRVNIQTDGWFATAKSNRLDNIPFYPNQSKLVDEGSMRVKNEAFKQSHIDPNKNLIVSYFNIREFSDLRSDSFVLETKVRFDDIQGIVCPYMEVKIIDEKDASWLGITDKGCVSNLNVKVGDTILSGMENDFSALGTNMSEWQTIRLVSSNQRLKYYLNDELALDTDFKGERGKIMGLIFTFTGKGAVDFVRLNNLEGEKVYSEDFN